MKAFAALHRATARLPGERYVVDRPVDLRGQYQLDLAGEFPLALKRLVYAGNDPAPPFTWHTYLELFVLLSPTCRFQLGGAIFALARGDVLVVDHLKLHAVLDFPGERAEALVVRFLPEMVRSPGTAGADHLMLLPFVCQEEARPHVVRADEPAAEGIHEILAHVVENYAASGRSPYWQTGVRAHFLVLLHHLARHFQAAERLQELHARQQPLTGRLRAVFEFIATHHADRISLTQAATMAGLSRPQFHAVFKRATGRTLVEYVTQVRLAQAARLLQESDHSIAEIASTVGFADQSYFDRRFRRHFGQTPGRYRKGAVASTDVPARK